MSGGVKIAFEPKRLRLKIDQLVPSKTTPPNIKATTKFKQISKSLAEVGLVEPIVVHAIGGAEQKYMILDGHLRVMALADAGDKSAICIEAKDDEGFTYNKHVNRLSSIQEHYMILEAIAHGVPEKRIADALGVHVNSIRRKRNLLRDICPEVVEILKHTNLPSETARILRKVTPIRQIEIAELMIAADNTSGSYAKALYMATSPAQLRTSERKKIKGLSDDDRRSMEHEMESIQRDIRSVENNYGTNMLRLVVANGYVGRLIECDAVSRYLKRNHMELLDQLLMLQDSIDADMGVLPE